MNTRQQHSYCAFVGIVRSDRKIDIPVLDPPGNHLGHHQISSRPNALQDWIIDLRKQFPEGTIAFCIEQPCANLVAFFTVCDFIDLILVNPATFRKWHDAFKPSRARNDASDSAGLAELTHQNHPKLTIWETSRLQNPPASSPTLTCQYPHQYQ